MFGGHWEWKLVLLIHKQLHCNNYFQLIWLLYVVQRPKGKIVIYTFEDVLVWWVNLGMQHRDSTNIENKNWWLVLYDFYSTIRVVYWLFNIVIGSSWICLDFLYFLEKLMYYIRIKYMTCGITKIHLVYVKQKVVKHWGLKTLDVETML